jgi:cobaltochelatase CobN
VLESEILYLLGVEPVWDSYNNIHDVKLIPTGELGRPRIDAVVTMSGIYRENWPRQIELINKAVRLASEADDSPHHRNFVNESTRATYNWLIGQNDTYTESQARDLSLIRIFGPPEGVWGVGGFTSAIAGTGTWDSEETIADLYIRNMANVYGNTIWGEQYVDIFKQNLDGIEVAVFSWTSHSHSVLGIDHTFEFFGGLSMAVRSITGESPDMYINNLKNQGGAKLETLQHVLMRDLRSIYYNELWIKGMMEHGYAGAGSMSTIMSNLWGWQVTNPDLITDEMWNTMHSIYVQDEYDLGLTDWLNENNAWARQEMMARMIEATRMRDSEGNPYWTPSDATVLQSLAQEYQQSVKKYGPCCCIVCCGYAMIDSYVQGIISAAQPPEEQQQQQQQYPRGGGGSSVKREELTAEGVTNQTIDSGVGITGEAIEKPPAETGETVKEVKKGKVMKEEKTAPAPPISGAPLMGLIAVLVIMVFVGVGFGIKRRR